MRGAGHRLAAFPDVDRAAAWVQNNAGQSSLAVRRLYEQALTRLLEMPDRARGVSVG
jgi:hypothetical protein